MGSVTARAFLGWKENTSNEKRAVGLRGSEGRRLGKGGGGVRVSARKSLAAFLFEVLRRSLGLSVSLRAAGSLGSALKTTATKQNKNPPKTDSRACLKETVRLASRSQERVTRTCSRDRCFSAVRQVGDVREEKR